MTIINPGTSSHSRSSSSPTSLSDVVIGTLGLCAFCLGLWGLISAVSILVATTGFLMGDASWDTLPGLAANVAQSVFFGLCAGAAVALFRSTVKSPGQVETFISALFNRRLGAPELDAQFFGQVALNGVVGVAVGYIVGAAGATALPAGWSDASTGVLSAATPILAFAGGGFGGPGAGFWGVIMLILVIIFLALIVAVLSSLLFHLVLFGIGGAMKGGVRSYTTRLLVGGTATDTPAGVRRVIAESMRRGFLVGGLVALIHSISTAMNFG